VCHVREVRGLFVLGVDGGGSRVERWSWKRFGFEGRGGGGRRKSVGRWRRGEILAESGGRRGGGLHVERFEER